MKEPPADGIRYHTKPHRFTLKSPRGDRRTVADFSTTGLITYEQKMTRDPRWALMEGSRHFEEKSQVFDALRKITTRLQDLNITYAVVGGLALFQHGLRRFTEDVDILVTKEDLKTIHEKLEGLGYLPPHAHSKHLRDTELRVRIEFLTTGEYPGDGKEKPVSFPEPGSVRFEVDGIYYLDLRTLIELKLASGMTNSGRLKDLSDVLELIKILDLPADYAQQLNPFVREKFQELWAQGRKRYEMLWRNKWLTSEARTIEDMITALRGAADALDEMRKSGVVLEDDGGVGDDYARLVTTDSEVAKKFGMDEEPEYLEEDEDSGPAELE